MTRLLCRAIRNTLAARVLDVGRPPSPVAGHVSRCLRCQAVVAQSRRVHRTLSTLPVPTATQQAAGGPSAGWVAAGVASVVAASLVVARLRVERFQA